MAYRKAKGLCFKCGERWGQSHVCSATVPVHLVEEVWAMAVGDSEEVDFFNREPEAEENSDEQLLAISFHAVQGGQGRKTIRLHGSVASQDVLILVDSGSSASFIGDHLNGIMNKAKKLHQPLRVKVADGGELQCNSVIPECEWLCQGRTFYSELKVLPLSGYDIILGMDWLKQFSPMTLHWAQKWMAFNYKGRLVHLQGVQPVTEHCKLISLDQVEGLVKREAIEPILEISLCTERQNSEVEVEAIKELISQFASVFQEPTGLPPKRDFDHAIPLIPGAQPFRLRAYRFTPQQNDEIERQVQELLKNGVIQQSHSLFASPVLLVKKKDGEWRLCVDYRKLNTYTVKDKFPIRIFDEIVDELAGSRVFSKLDHRLGYHQVCIKEGHEYKTAFQTHSGHYEYKVMSFGLTGAPATFQAFMNFVLAPLLRKMCGCILG